MHLDSTHFIHSGKCENALVCTIFSIFFLEQLKRKIKREKKKCSSRSQSTCMKLHANWTSDMSNHLQLWPTAAILLTVSKFHSKWISAHERIDLKSCQNEFEKFFLPFISAMNTYLIIRHLNFGLELYYIIKRLYIRFSDWGYMCFTHSSQRRRYNLSWAQFNG